MRKIVVTEFVSLDGVIENPGWSAPYWNDEIAKFKGDEQMSAEALLLGRVTYEGFAAAWPQSKDEGAAEMNAMPKYVASTTLTETTWNATVLEGDTVEAIKRLKQEDGGDLLVYGSATLVQTLIKNNLVDVYRMLVYPVVLGKGIRMFQDGAEATLKLVEQQHFSSGVVGLVYEPVKA